MNPVLFHRRKQGDLIAIHPDRAVIMQEAMRDLRRPVVEIPLFSADGRIIAKVTAVEPYRVEYTPTENP